MWSGVRAATVRYYVECCSASNDGSDVVPIMTQTLRGLVGAGDTHGREQIVALKDGRYKTCMLCVWVSTKAVFNDRQGIMHRIRPRPELRGA